MELPERDMKRPLRFTDLAQAIEGKIDSLADANSGSADEQQGVGHQVIGVAELLLQPSIVLRGKWFGQIVIWGRKILSTNEIVVKRMAIVGQVMEQTAKPDEVKPTDGIAQRRIMFTKEAEPAQEMGIAAQLMQLPYLRESSVEIGKELAGAGAILGNRFRPQNGGQDTEVIVEDLLESRSRRLHEISADKRMRWATARAYSRQTS
jgi:hypothetical protein